MQKHLKNFMFPFFFLTIKVVMYWLENIFRDSTAVRSVHLEYPPICSSFVLLLSLIISCSFLIFVELCRKFQQLFQVFHFFLEKTCFGFTVTTNFLCASNWNLHFHPTHPIEPQIVLLHSTMFSYYFMINWRKSLPCNCYGIFF